MTEYERFDYGTVNLPVHLMFSHFIAFCQDKLAKPEFLCWPGAWMAGARLSPEVENLFRRHEALFMDQPDYGGFYPRLIPGKDERVVQEVFEKFYAVNVAYDLTRQWIAQSGPFEYDYRYHLQSRMPTGRDSVIGTSSTPKSISADLVLGFRGHLKAVRLPFPLVNDGMFFSVQSVVASLRGPRFRLTKAFYRTAIA